MTSQYKFRTVDTIVWKDGMVVTGTIAELGSMEIEGNQRKFMIGDTGTALCRVFEAAGLEDAWEHATVGDSINIENHGLKPTKGGRSFRQFAVQVWTN